MVINASGDHMTLHFRTVFIFVFSAFFMTIGLAGTSFAQPTFSKVFSPDSIGPGSTTTLIFTIDNSASVSPVTSLDFTDVLPITPATLVVATPANASTTCSFGTLTAVAGSGTISYTGGAVGGSSTCTVSVDVTAPATTGTYTNTSGDLTSSAGVSGSATDGLVVSSSEPGFTKAFSPATIDLGQTSTLTFIIDNSANAAVVAFAAFTDNLPAGMKIASTPNATTTCTTAASFRTLTALPGGTSITFQQIGSPTPGLGVVNAGASCSVSVDVVGEATGALNNSVGLQTVSSGPFVGSAVATLTVNPLSTTLPTLVKSFTNDPVAAGGTVNLEFTIYNPSSTFPATAIGFTDDLDAALTGLAVSGALPTDPCGAGSTLTGTSLLTLAGGSLPAGGNCTFSVSLAVPGGATPGDHTNTTSTVAATINGDTVFGPAATDFLQVSENAPLIISKTFTNDPATPGGTVDLEFTITNPNAGTAVTTITFTDVLTDVMSGLTLSAPLSLPCGGASSFSETDPFTHAIGLTDGALAGGASCTFTATLDIDAGVPGGTFPNTTSAVSATIGGSTVQGNTASDSLVINAPLSLTLTKAFSVDNAVPGTTVDITFTIDNSSDSVDATAITFSDDMDIFNTGALFTSVGANSCAGSTVTGTGTKDMVFAAGSLLANTSCSFTVTVTLGPTSAGTGSNTTSDLSASPNGGAVEVATGTAATDTITVSTRLPVTITKTFTDDPVLAGDTATLEFTITNPNVMFDATEVTFFDSLSFTGFTSVTLLSSGVVPAFSVAAVLPGLAVSGALPSSPCGGTITGTTLLTFTGGFVASGTSCTFSVTVLVPGGTVDGSYANTTTPIYATVDSTIVNSAAATDNLDVQSDILQFSKSFTDDPVLSGATASLTFTILNTSTYAITDLAFTDDLDAMVSGATGTVKANTCNGTPADGATVSLSGGTLAASATCTIDVDVAVPLATTSGTYPNTTSTLTGTANLQPVTGDPAVDSLEVTSALAPTFTKSFLTDPAAPGAAVGLRFTITNPPGGSTYSDLEFTDDLDAALMGLVATGLPTADVCGTGSSVSGTGTLIFDGGVLAPGASCTFDVTVVVPSGAPDSTYTNTTSNLFENGLFVAGAASDTLQVLAAAAPTFTKSFLTDPAAPGTTISLRFTIDNPAVGAALTDLSFTDDLDAVITGFAATGLPTADVCGTGSSVSGTSIISLTGGNLAAGTSCTFDVSVAIPAAAADSTYTNTTSSLMEGGLALLAGASDTLTITATLQPTIDTINDFLVTRTNELLSNGPSSGRRFERLNQNGQSNRNVSFGHGDLLSLLPFSAQGVGVGVSSDELKFSTSLAQIRKANAKLAASLGSKGETVDLPLYDFDVWFEATTNRYSAPGGSAGRFAVYYLGADYLVNPNVLVGVLVQVDSLTDRNSTAGSTASGVGWMAGPYVTARIGPNLYFDGRVAYGTSTNLISPLNTYTDGFNTTRWLVDATLSGEIQKGDWRIRPNASVSFIQERQASYVDSLAVTIPSQTVSLGQLRVGPEFSTTLQGRRNSVVVPHFSIEGIFNMSSTTGVTTTNAASVQANGWRARAEAGVTMTDKLGTQLSIAGHYDGIGASAYSSYGATVRLVIPLQQR